MFRTCSGERHQAEANAKTAARKRLLTPRAGVGLVCAPFPAVVPQVVTLATGPAKRAGEWGSPGAADDGGGRARALETIVSTNDSAVIEAVLNERGGARGQVRRMMHATTECHRAAHASLALTQLGSFPEEPLIQPEADPDPDSAVNQVPGIRGWYGRCCTFTM